MSSDLVPFTVDSLPAVTDDQLSALDNVTEDSTFLPRIQLITKGQYVDSGKIAPGHWGIPQSGGEKITDLGETIDVLPLAVRLKALDTSDRENVIAVFDPEDEEFQRIKNAPKNTGCMWGPSFLILERSTSLLYELFFGNKSGRREAPALRPFLQNTKAATLSIRLIRKQYTWHVPVVNKCSEPITEGPDAAVVREEIKKFLTPKQGPERVPEADIASGRAR